MPNLKYKTRGNSSPQSKPRVYFCCHPKDFQTYFECISDEILTKQNCAIWYHAEPKADYDELFFTDLLQMQLFVMPITTNLLVHKNHALDVEFPFAVEHHIPVLPLMQESGLTELFNEKCGDLQFLDKNSKDTTSISYDEKLEQYLSSILIGDELTNQIRAAFDAYVFLSYRKKDRKHAQELMRLIHKNDFCRDIAIWYDEFLIPGENFSEAIRDALSKSELFVLTVTPNLVNEINYIMTTEYPMAKKLGKPILPAELISTDQALLAEKYADFPGCTNAHNKRELSDSLLHALKMIALRDHDTSPVHTFFMGLAYLSGVDVEVDHERALSLITSAADAGVSEAARKLVEMYRSGLGVQRSYDTAILWQEKLILQLEEVFLAEASPENLDILFWGIYECGNYYWELRNLDEALEKFTQAMQFLESSPHRSINPQIQRDLTAVYNRTGDLYGAEWDNNIAADYYQKALTIAEKLAQENGTMQARRDLAVSYNRVSSMGSRAQGLEFAYKALKIYEDIANETNSIRARTDLAYSYRNLGRLSVDPFDHRKSMDYFNKALRICEELVLESNTIQAREALANCYICLAEYKPDAIKTEYLKKALQIQEEIAAEKGTVESSLYLAAEYERFAKHYHQIPSLEMSYRKRQCKILKKASRKTDIIQVWHNLSACYAGLGYARSLILLTFKQERWDMYLRTYHLDGIADCMVFLSERWAKLAAKHYCKRAMKIAIYLCQRIGTLRYRKELIERYEEYSDSCRDAWDLPGAVIYRAKTFQVYEKLAAKANSSEIWKELADLYSYSIDIEMKEKIGGILPNIRRIKYLKRLSQIHAILEEDI